jgi:hypothetical protein
VHHPVPGSSRSRPPPLEKSDPAAGSELRAQVIHLPAWATWSGEWVDYDSSGAFDATQEILLDFSTTLNTSAAFFVGLRIENAAGAVGWIATSASSPPVRP